MPDAVDSCVCVWRLSGSRLDQLVAIYLEFYILQSRAVCGLCGGVREMRAYSSSDGGNYKRCSAHSTIYYTGSLIPSDHPRRQPFLTVAIALATVPQEGVGLWPVELGGVAAYGSHWHCNT